ncbi:MAG: hypothetical protein HN742_10110 [Lentisphaerae bacterium]|jgi:hypothetical protein|nr:hypothetical protein [Lentisphaerota bacterium]MBT4823452.1 hypothetical protein [Lentisphaerota bacterium]MBT5606949.1 hypothetical protein [Lentisphaerota bacterium]MBT7055102.1 hypothetical protein [Lentisphaerota bacterium]MBT7842216.1 hypothetical protein [Lentisphaerota bacterium]
MTTRKYGGDAYGDWTRDDNSLPCYDLDISRLPHHCPPLLHLLGTGTCWVLPDQFAALPLITAQTNPLTCLNAASESSLGGIRLTLGADDVRIPFLPADLETAPPPTMRWGIGYVRYTGLMSFGTDGPALTVELDVTAPRGTPFVVLSLGLTNAAEHEVSLEASVSFQLNPSPSDGFAPTPHAFTRPGVAILADVHEQVGDVFIAGAEAWSPLTRGRYLALEHDMTIPGNGRVDARFLVGASRQCSVDWLRDELETYDPEAVRASWAESLASVRPRAPELWMQEECVWDTGRLLAYAAPLPGSEETVIHPGGGAFAVRHTRPEKAPSSPAARDLLALGLALTSVAPEQARKNLVAALRAQETTGRIRESVGSPAGAAVDARADRSDGEIWLLVSWMEYLNANPALTDALDEPVTYATGEQEPVWEHLKRAVGWIRDEIREGPNGFLRILRGDWSAHLNRVGTEGQGESVLSTAMACFAAQRLEEAARHRGEERFADEIAEWKRTLRMSVSEAFRGRWFIRAFTDDGRPVGGPEDGRLFTAVQAWAVLARCGTLSERESALDALMQTNASDALPLRTVSPAYPLPPPADVSDLGLLPGDGVNGGIVLPVAAWAIWALATEGRRQEAITEWQKLALRKRGAESGSLPLGLQMALDQLAYPQRGTRQGGPTLTALQSLPALPVAHASAWQAFTLKKILG